MSTQTQFIGALLDAAAPVPDGLVDPEGRAAGKRFDVYRNNVIVSLVAALRDGFPALNSLLGPEYFDALAGIYVRQHPPSDPRLMNYGASLPQFLSGFEPLAHLPYLADVARLELAIRTSYHAADHTPVTPDQLAAIPPEALGNQCFGLAPSAVLIHSPYPIVGIRAKALGGNMGEARAHDVLVARAEFDPIPHILAPGVLSFLTALSDGRALGDAAGLAAEAAPEFDLSAALGLSLSAQILTERAIP